MPTPDTNGLPPFADFDQVKAKVNELVAKYNNLLVNLDSLNVVSLTANHVDTGTLDANLVTIRSDLTEGAFVQIDGNGMRINNGLFDTFTADIEGQVTMTRALIQSSPSGYPRIVMDPEGQLFGAYFSADNFINMKASDAGDPLLFFQNGSSTVRHALIGSTYFTGVFGSLSLAATGNVEIEGTGSSSIISLLPGTGAAGRVTIPNWNKLFATDPNQNLQTVLNGKATSGASTGSAGSANGGIAPGTELVTTTGTVTWLGIPSHVHTQN